MPSAWYAPCTSTHHWVCIPLRAVHAPVKVVWDVTVTVFVTPPELTLNRLAAVSTLMTVPVKLVAWPIPGVGVGVGGRRVGVAVGDLPGVGVDEGVVPAVEVVGVVADEGVSSSLVEALT